MHKVETISCGSCNKKLINYVVSDPSFQMRNDIIAKCPFCNGQSFKHQIQGKIHIGPIGKNESNYPTTIINIDYSSATNNSGVQSSIVHLTKGRK